ncbi:hypothetical protein Mapa_009914 [Marchantia paleacea]|nr:hypothetical protein Mapa_009914 [Marchantia paleacea]
MGAGCSWIEMWNGLSSSLDGFSTATIMTSIIIVIPTILWIFSSLSMRARLKGRPPIPPGSTGLPLIGESAQFVLALSRENGLRTFLRERMKSYGPVFKSHVLGSTMIFMDAPAGNKFLFQNEGKLVENSWPASVAALLGHGSLTMKKGEDYKLARRYIAGFFNQGAVMGYLARVDENASRHFAMYWQGKKELSSLKMASAFTFVTISDLLVGLQEGPEMEELCVNFTRWAFGVLKVPINLPGFAYYDALKARKRILEMLSVIVTRRRQELAVGNVIRDVLTNLLTVPDESGRLYTDAEIMDNLLLFLFAGFDTSSVALSMVITYVAKHSQVYELLVKEHKEIVERKRKRGESDSLTPENLSAMKYTGRVIQETLRVQPPVSGTLREAITDFEYNGYTILKGWKFMWTNQHSHYDPEFFRNPESFDPSRFESPPIPYTFVAFGGGPRTCPGYDFAKMEMLVFVHHLVKNYQWSLVDPDEPIIRNPMPRTATGTPIRITKIDP